MGLVIYCYKNLPNLSIFEDLLRQWQTQWAFTSRIFTVKYGLCLFLCLQINGNHETMNVEGDFRYVDPGAFDECMNFLEYLDDYENDWEGAFVGWLGASQRWKEHRKISPDYWGPWSVLKVLEVLGFMFTFWILTCLHFLLRICWQKMTNGSIKNVLINQWRLSNVWKYTSGDYSCWT